MKQHSGHKGSGVAWVHQGPSAWYSASPSPRWKIRWKRWMRMLYIPTIWWYYVVVTFDLCILHIFMMFSYYTIYNMRYLEDSMKILVGTTCSTYFVTLKVVGGKGILMSLSPSLHWLLQIYPRTILVRGKCLGFTLLSRPNTSESMWKFAPSASNTAIAPEDLDILTCQRSATANSQAGLSDWHMTVVCSKNQDIARYTQIQKENQCFLGKWNTWTCGFNVYQLG